MSWIVNFERIMQTEEGRAVLNNVQNGNRFSVIVSDDDASTTQSATIIAAERVLSSEVSISDYRTTVERTR